MASVDPPFLRIPQEIRFIIYGYLLDDGGQKMLSVRNLLNRTDVQNKRRTKYHIVTTVQQHYLETTYRVVGDTPMHPQIMVVNKHVYAEASHLLYAAHSFDFGLDVEAVGPFLSDLTPMTRALIPEIRVHKRAPNPFLQSDIAAWNAMCRSLARAEGLQKLTLVVQGRKPRDAWEGPQELSISDFRLLNGIKHECLEWVAALEHVKGVQHIEVIPDLQYSHSPTSTESLIFAAFSASIQGAFARFLREDFGLPIQVC